MIPWWVLLLAIPAAMVIGAVGAVCWWLSGFLKDWGRSW